VEQRIMLGHYLHFAKTVAYETFPSFVHSSAGQRNWRFLDELGLPLTAILKEIVIITCNEELRLLGCYAVWLL
jgi:hypothetical protein